MEKEVLGPSTSKKCFLSLEGTVMQKLFPRSNRSKVSQLLCIDSFMVPISDHIFGCSSGAFVELTLPFLDILRC